MSDVRGYRLTLLMKCEGLTPGQLARRSVPPSTLSRLGLARRGLARHLAECECDWRAWIHPDRPEPALYGDGHPSPAPRK